MKKSILISFLIFALAGCGAQHGKYVTTSDQSVSFSSNVGCVEIVSGHKNTDEKAAQENLLYVLLVCPTSDKEITSNGSSADFGAYITTLRHTWSLVSNVFSVDVRWDRETDTVSIGKDQFPRTNGNVFVAQSETNGHWTFQQVTNLGPHANCQQTLEAIQQRLTNDQLIRSLKLVNTR